MSFDIQWDTICNDEQLASSFQDFLNSKLSTLELPHYLANLQVVDFKLGNAAPEITIRDIGIPFNEFYAAMDDEEDEESEDEPSSIKKDYDNTHHKEKNRISILKNQIPPSRSASPHPFMNNHNSILLPRTNSGYVPTIGYSGVGLGGFGMAQTNNASNGSGSMDSESEYFQPSYNENTAANDEGKIFSGLVNGAGNTTITDSDIEGNNNHSHSNTNFNGSFSSGDELNNDLDTSLDIQLSVDVNWDSELYVEIVCDLLVNYPAPNFIRLPVRLKITDLKIHSLMVVACISKRVFISFLCDIDDDESGNNDDNTATNDSRQDSRRSTTTSMNNTRTPSARSKGRERIDILQDVKIEGEIGNVSESAELWRDNNLLKPLQQQQQEFRNFKDLDIGSGSNFLSGFGNNDDLGDGNGLVLRNIGKIEKFLMSAFRGLIIDELAWPGWIELDFNESVPDEEEEDDDEADNGGAGTGCNEDDDGDKNDKDDVGGMYNLADIQRNLPEDNGIIHRTLTSASRASRNAGGRPSVVDKDALRSVRSMKSTPSSYADDSSMYSSDSYFTSDDES